MKKKLFLLDSMALAYRAYFALIANPLRNSKGENTSAIFGFVNAVLKIINDEKPDCIAAVFDTREPTFRHEAYSQYKATRERMPEDMIHQLPVIKQVTEALGIPVIELPGFEADDIIGTLARQAERDGVDVYMVTGDKDFMQLVSPQIRMYNPIRKGGVPEIVGADGVFEKFGVRPDQVTDILGLMGDTADNIPGVKGIGEKTATKLIQEFGSIEELYKNLDRVKGKLAENLRANESLARLSKTLATIHTDVPIEMTWKTLVSVPYHTEEAISLFRQLEFSSLAARLVKERPQLVQEVSTKKITNSTAVEFRIIHGIKDLPGLLNAFEGADRVSICVDLDPSNSTGGLARGMVLSPSDNKAWYIPFTSNELLASLKPHLQNPAIRKSGEHLKEDTVALRYRGLDMEGLDTDLLIAGSLLYPEGFVRFERLLNDHVPEWESDFMVESPERHLGIRTAAAGKIRGSIRRALKKDGLEKVFDEIEMPLVPVLAEMEYHGVWVDKSVLSEMSKEFSRESARQQDIIFKEAGQEFNLNSPQQLGEILFDKMQIHKLAGVDKPKRTGKTKQYATDVKVLEMYRSLPIVEAILSFRQLTKLKSTYIDGLPPLINPITSRIHSTFSQTVAATGRLSSSNPNFQNIPIRTDLGREIRRAFTAQKRGWQLFSADYSQIELRVLAHLSGDEALKEAFNKDEDIHASTASRVFGIDLNSVPRDLRRKAKDINFGIVYGISPFGLASRIGMTQAEAKQFIANYFEKYPGIKTGIDKTLQFGRENGFVTTLFGRRRYLPDLRSQNYAVRQNAERAAINTPIQGTAAEIIKIAMIHIQEKMRRNRMKSMMILQVHDELVFEAPQDEITELRQLVKTEMESAVTLAVPLKVDTGAGDNWLETK